MMPLRGEPDRVPPAEIGHGAGLSPYGPLGARYGFQDGGPSPDVSPPPGLVSPGLIIGEGEPKVSPQ